MSDYAHKTRELQEKEVIIRNQQAALDRQNRMIQELQSQNASFEGKTRAQSSSVLRGHKDMLSLVGSMSGRRPTLAAAATTASNNNPGGSSNNINPQNGSAASSSSVLADGTNRMSVGGAMGVQADYAGKVMDKNRMSVVPGSMSGAMIGGMVARNHSLGGLGYDPRMSVTGMAANYSGNNSSGNSSSNSASNFGPYGGGPGNENTRPM